VVIGFSADEADPVERFRRLEDLPPSAKLVHYVMDEEGSMTGDQIREQTLLPERTVRDAVSRLRDADIVVTRIDPADPPRHAYSLRPVERPDDRE